MTTIDRLVQQFAENVALQTDAIWRGNSSGGNRYAKRYIKAFAELRKLGDRGRDALLPLFQYPRPDVRVAAAACLLRHREAEARAVLEEAARGKGLVAFEAEQALERWNEGTWNLDPPD
jgi:hypothetical protein